VKENAMIVNEEIRKKLVKNLKEWKKELNCHLELCIEEMERVRTVEDLMRYKRNLLYIMVRELPLQATACYFCLLHGQGTEKLDCEKCEYGKLHGICFESDSDYYSILKARNELLRKIEFLYYRGEEYK